MTDKNASELAAERLGFGETDPHAEVLSEIEEMLANHDEWTADDRAAARATIDRAKALPPRKPEPKPEEPKRRPATASEIAAAHMLNGRTAARDLARDGVEDA